jgi:hypothetical protein
MYSDQDEYTDAQFIEELKDILDNYPNDFFLLSFLLSENDLIYLSFPGI